MAKWTLGAWTNRRRVLCPAYDTGLTRFQNIQGTLAFDAGDPRPYHALTTNSRIAQLSHTELSLPETESIWDRFP